MGKAATSYDDERYPWILPAVKFLRQLGDKHSHVRIVAIWLESASFFLTSG